MTDSKTQKIDRSLRKRELTFGALFMFLFALAVAIVTVEAPPSHSVRIILLVIAWLVLTLLINIKPMLRYFLQAESSSNEVSTTETFSSLSAKIKHAALPSSHSMPAEDLIMPSVNTAEMAKPASVTERTTNLFEKQ